MGYIHHQSRARAGHSQEGTRDSFSPGYRQHCGIFLSAGDENKYHQNPSTTHRPTKNDNNNDDDDDDDDDRTIIMLPQPIVAMKPNYGGGGIVASNSSHPTSRLLSMIFLSPATILIIISAFSFFYTTSIVPSIMAARDDYSVGHLRTTAAAAFQDTTAFQDTKKYDFTAAMCLITSDGEAYFQEWVDYHLLAMQFEAIYVYDNSDKFDLKRWYENTRNHPIYKRVEIKHTPDKKEGNGVLQISVYKECIKQYGTDPDGPKHDYFALIDNDEFLVPQTDKYTSIHGVLADYLVPFGGALVSNWVLFGTANRTVYSPVPVTKRFQYRDPGVHPMIKTIVKASDYHVNRNPHAVVLNKNPQKIHTLEYPGAIDPIVHNATDNTKAVSYGRPSEVLLIYHYRYASEKEYYYKRCVRGQISQYWCNKNTGAIRTNTPEHIQSRPGTVFDDKAWQLLKAKVPRYQTYDTPGWEDFF